MAEIVAGFKEFCDEVEGGVLPEVMHEALQPTFLLARDTYTPVDTGELRGSGYNEVVRRRGGPQAEVGFKAPYAIFVHEMPFHHNPPTSSKYLQRALDEDYFKILQRIVAGVKSRTGI